MSEEAGHSDSNTVEVGRIAELEKALAQNRQIQSGLDSKVTSLTKQLEEARQSLAGYQQAVPGFESRIADLSKLNQELTQQLTSFSELAPRAQALEARATQLETIIGKIDSPLATLAANGALPPFEGNPEEYSKKVDAILGAINKHAETLARSNMDGYVPSVAKQQPRQMTREELYSKASKLMISGDAKEREEGERLYNQYLETMEE